MRSEGVKSEKWADAWYDLQGRRMANGILPKGLYIRGGRKVVVQ